MNLNTLRFLLVGLGLLARPAAVQAQLTCTTNAGKITITGYSGFDPEVGAEGGFSNNMYGVDKGTYPQARTYMLGINFNF